MGLFSVLGDIAEDTVDLAGDIIGGTFRTADDIVDLGCDIVEDTFECATDFVDRLFD